MLVLFLLLLALFVAAELHALKGSQAAARALLQVDQQAPAGALEQRDPSPSAGASAPSAGAFEERARRAYAIRCSCDGRDS